MVDVLGTRGRSPLPGACHALTGGSGATAVYVLNHAYAGTLYTGSCSNGGFQHTGTQGYESGVFNSQGNPGVLVKSYYFQ